MRPTKALIVWMFFFGCHTFGEFDDPKGSLNNTNNQNNSNNVNNSNNATNNLNNLNNVNNQNNTNNVLVPQTNNFQGNFWEDVDRPFTRSVGSANDLAVDIVSWGDPRTVAIARTNFNGDTIVESAPLVNGTIPELFPLFGGEFLPIQANGVAIQAIESETGSETFGVAVTGDRLGDQLVGWGELEPFNTLLLSVENLEIERIIGASISGYERGTISYWHTEITTGGNRLVGVRPGFAAASSFSTPLFSGEVEYARGTGGGYGFLIVDGQSRLWNTDQLPSRGQAQPMFDFPEESIDTTFWPRFVWNQGVIYTLVTIDAGELIFDEYRDDDVEPRFALSTRIDLGVTSPIIAVEAFGFPGETVVAVLTEREVHFIAHDGEVESRGVVQHSLENPVDLRIDLFYPGGDSIQLPVALGVVRDVSAGSQLVGTQLELVD